MMKKQFLRLLLLERSLSMKGKDIGSNYGDKRWYLLGNFDYLYSKVFTNNSHNLSLFQIIKNESDKICSCNDATSYFYPIFLVSDNDENDTNLWEDSSLLGNFWGVIRIHMSSSTGDNQKKNEIKEFFKKIFIGKSSCYVFYDTLELSDIVVVVRSQKLQDILEIASQFQKNEHVGKTYSYFAIHSNYINNADIDNADIDSADIIPFAAMHFSVSDNTQAANALDKISRIMGASIYTPSGFDDVIIYKNDIQTEKLIKVFRTFQNKDKDEDEDYAPFKHVATQLGAKSCVESWKTFSDQALTAACNKCFDDFLAIKGKYNDCHWVCPATALMDTLVYMSKSPELDEFVYLMLPAVRAFLKNAKYEDRAISTKAERFFSGWSFLLEHILRTESQLTYYPEVRLRVFDVPVIVLEYLLVLIEKCREVLQSGDGGSEMTPPVRLLLVPNLCERIEAVELFPCLSPEGSVKEGLILVNIPLNLLYDTRNNIIVLCHEVAHYVGEKPRERNKRNEKYIVAAAVSMAKTVFNTFNFGFITALRAQIENYLSNKWNGNRQNATLRKVEGEIFNYAKSITLKNNFSVYLELVKNAIKQAKKEDNAITILSDVSKLQNKVSTDFFTQLKNITTLFRETYADLCMLFMLSLNAEEYIQTFKEEIEASNEFQIEMFTIRIYCCLKASGISFTERDFEGLANDKLYLSMKKLKEDLAGDTESGQTIPTSSIQALLDYLIDCYGILRELPKANEIKVIQKLKKDGEEANIINMSSQIAEYRKNMVQTKETD